MIIFYRCMIGLILSFITVYYFDLSLKKLSLPLITLLFSVTIFIFDSLNLHITLLNIVFIIEIVTIISFYKHHFDYEAFMIASMLMIAKIIAKIISFHTIYLTTQQSIEHILSHQNYLDFAFLLELIFFIFACLNIYLFKLKKSDWFHYENWQELLVLLIIIFSSLSFFEHVLLTRQFMEQLVLVISLTLLTLSIFFIYTYHKILQISKENTEYLLNEQRHQYRSMNKDALLRASEDMKSLEHRMSYSLLQIKDYILHNNQESALYIIDQYTNQIHKYKSSIHTDNPYFDYIMNSKINHLYMYGYSLKLTTTLNYKQVLENQDVLDMLIKIIDYYASISEDFDIAIECIDKGHFLLFTISTYTHISTHEISDKIKQHTFLYTIKNSDFFVSCQFLIEDNPHHIS